MTEENHHPRNPVGCATPSKLAENATDLPSSGPFSDDVYTKRLHNQSHCQWLNPSERWNNRENSVYTKRLGRAYACRSDARPTVRR